MAIYIEDNTSAEDIDGNNMSQTPEGRTMLDLHAFSDNRKFVYIGNIFWIYTGYSIYKPEVDSPESFTARWPDVAVLYYTDKGEFIK